jgi:hypothetical protein
MDRNFWADTTMEAGALFGRSRIPFALKYQVSIITRGCIGNKIYF